MENSRTIRERRGLRVIRVLTNMLMLTGSAAALGLFAGASQPALAAVCLFMVSFALGADQLQHRVRSFRMYTVFCLGGAAATAAVGRLAIPQVWIPLAAISLVEIWCLFGSRVTQRPAFVPNPFLLMIPMLIWMVGAFGGVSVLCALAFAMETGLVLLFLSWHNHKSLERTYIAATERTRVPYSKIRRLNAGLLFVYLTAALLLCVGLMAVCGGGEAMLLVINAILVLFGMIVGAIIWLFILLVSWMAGGNFGGPAGAVNPFDLKALEELFPWLRTLWFIMDHVLIVIGAVVVIYLIYWNLYSLYYNFLAADPETGDTRKRQNAREKTRKIYMSPERLPLLAGIGPAAGIRREYIALVRAYPNGTELPGSYTPSQIEYAVAGEEALEEEWREIHQLYEKARFAPHLVDRSDLRRMRELARRRSEAEARRREMEKRGLI